MFNIKSGTFFCFLSIISCTVADSDADDDDVYSFRRVPKPVEHYFRDTPLALSLGNSKSIPSLFSLLKFHGQGGVPSVDWRSTTKVQQYRNKLLAMITKIMDDLETNRAYIKTFILQNPNDSKAVLRVGDLVKFVESKYNRLVQLYSKLRINRNTLPVPNLIHVYEEILRGKHEIATVLEVMHKKTPDRLIYTPGSTNGDRFESSIAWSYYDDNF